VGNSVDGDPQLTGQSGRTEAGQLERVERHFNVASSTVRELSLNGDGWICAEKPAVLVHDDDSERIRHQAPDISNEENIVVESSGVDKHSLIITSSMAEGPDATVGISGSAHPLKSFVEYVLAGTPASARWRSCHNGGMLVA
jgi:hypothetical protein